MCQIPAWTLLGTRFADGKLSLVDFRSSLAMSTPFSLPSFDDLPLDKEGPPGNAWGLFGKSDQLGRLNLITPATVAAAAQEIKEGIRVSLDWSLDKPLLPTFERKPFEHQITQLAPNINDDTIHINTQSSSQWDGLRHYGTATLRPRGALLLTS